MLSEKKSINLETYPCQKNEKYKRGVATGLELGRKLKFENNM